MMTNRDNQGDAKTLNSNGILHNVAASKRKSAKQCETKIDAVSFLMFRLALQHFEL